MNVYYAITAVPERREWVKAIRLRLPLETQIFWDTTYKGCWWNTRRAMLDMPPNADFMCLVQDDTLPVRNYYRHVEQIVKLFPTSIVSGYVGENHVARNRATLKRGAHFWTTAFGLTTPNIILPASFVREFVPWADRTFEMSKRMADVRVLVFQKLTSTQTVFPAPQLATTMGGRLSTLRTVERNWDNGAVMEVDPDLRWDEGFERVRDYPVDRWVFLSIKTLYEKCGRKVNHAKETSAP